MESNKLKEVYNKNSTCYYFDDVIKIKDFDFGNISMDEKSCIMILVYDILHKFLI